MTLREYLRLPSPELLEHLTRLVGRDRSLTVELVTCIAAVEVRRLYRELGFASTYAYCIATFNMSGDMAYRRIHAARAMLRFPQIMPALADGRLHLTAVALIAPRLNPKNVESLIEAATHRTKVQILAMLADRYPQPDVPTQLRDIQPIIVKSQRSAAEVAQVSDSQKSLAPARVPLCGSMAPAQLPNIEFASVHPLAPARFELRCTLSQTAYDALRTAQELLSHAIPDADAAKVIERALVDLVAQLEKKQLGARGDIPAQVVREVHERDGYQCTFIGTEGHRCAELRHLELDHIRPRSCGGRSTPSNLRLRCRVHNQYEAELLFGENFMALKRAKAVGEAGATPRSGPG